MTINPPLTDAERALKDYIENSHCSVDASQPLYITAYLNISTDIVIRTALKQADKARGLVEALEEFDNDEGLSNEEYAVSWLSYILSPDNLKSGHKRKFDAICAIIRSTAQDVQGRE